MQTARFVFLLVALLAFCLVAWYVGRSRSQAILNYWAVSNGYRLIEQKYVRFFRGPFFWTSSRSQPVYRVVVEDQTGQRRSGWVCCGSWALGVLSNKVQVRWDE
jgi:hypothetical protein